MPEPSTWKVNACPVSNVIYRVLKIYIQQELIAPEHFIQQ